MESITIPQLPPTNLPITGNEVIVAVQDGVDRQLTISDMLAGYIEMVGTQYQGYLGYGEIVNLTINGNYSSYLARFGTNQTLACSDFDKGQMVKVFILNTDSANAISVTLPATGNYVIEGQSADLVKQIPADGTLQFVVWFINGKYHIIMI